MQPQTTPKLSMLSKDETDKRCFISLKPGLTRPQWIYYGFHNSEVDSSLKIDTCFQSPSENNNFQLG